jgi:hypothetical protein
MGDWQTTAAHKSLALLAFISEYDGGCLRHTTRGKAEEQGGAWNFALPLKKLRGLWVFTTWRCRPYWGTLAHRSH